LKIRNVLSLFDGMSCGQTALNRAGVEYNKYFAAEIDKFAIKTTQRNYPKTIQLGDVCDVAEVAEVDLLIGGSPCQGFSFAGKQLNFNDPRSMLFFEFVRILKSLKPKYFLVENVRMKKEYQDIISKYLGVEPIEINSTLVSAQNRRRLYWTNIPNVKQPEDKGILLKEILEKDPKNVTFMSDKFTNRFLGYGKRATDINTLKSKCLSAREYEKNGRQGDCVVCFSTSGRASNGVEFRMSSNEKAHTVSCGGYSSRSFSGVLDLAKLKLRKLTPIECERLQTLPDDYTEGVSNTQRYKMIGNGWTVDVIAHILKELK
jgi:DNA-cytosine methyltransferase